MRWRRTDSAPVARQAASTRPPPPATTHVETPLGSKQSSRNESQSIFYGKISIYKKQDILHCGLRRLEPRARLLCVKHGLRQPGSGAKRYSFHTPIVVPDLPTQVVFLVEKKLKFVGVITVVFLALCRFVVRKMYLLLFAV